MQIVFLFLNIRNTREAVEIIVSSMSSLSRRLKIRRPEMYRWKNVDLVKKQHCADFFRERAELVNFKKSSFLQTGEEMPGRDVT